MHEHEPAQRIDHRFTWLRTGSRGRDGGADGDAAVLGDLGGDEADAQDVQLAVGSREPQLRGKVLAHDVAVEQRHRPTTHLQQLDQEDVGDGGLAGAAEACEEHGEALLVAGRVGLPQLLGHLRKGEPLRDLAALGQSPPQVGPRDVQGLAARYFILRHVGVQLGQVDHHAEGHHAHAQLGLVLAQHLLGSVGVVEGLASRVRARPGVVATHDEVAAAVVLADGGVPEDLPRPRHAHGEGQQR